MLLTRELRTALRHNANLSEITERDHKPVVKFFTPDSSATWLFSELAADEDTLFGLCDLGHGTPELGYASLSQISVLRGPHAPSGRARPPFQSRQAYVAICG